MNPLETFEDTFDSPTLSPAPMQAELGSAPTVLHASFELFHKAPSSHMKLEESDAVSQYQLGAQDGERRAGELHAATIAALQTSLTQLQNGFAESLQNIQAQNTEIISQILGVIFPALADHSFTRDFKKLLQKLLEAELAGQIKIYASELDMPQIESLLAASPGPEAFSLISQDIPSGTLSLKWENGGADINYTETAQHAHQLLTQHFGTPINLDINTTEMSEI